MEVGGHRLPVRQALAGAVGDVPALEAIDEIITTAKQKNKFSGIHLMSVAELQPLIEKGMTCNLWSNDVSMLMASAREGVGQLK